jgi:hypothetical protein
MDVTPMTYEQRLIGDYGFRNTILEGREVFLVFTQRRPNGVIDYVRYGLVGVGHLQADGFVQRRFKVHRGSLRRFFAHGGSTSKAS